MTQICLITCLLCALTFVEMDTVNRTGRVGSNLTIICSNWKTWGYATHYVKYFCRSPCSEDKHIIIKADYLKSVRKGRIQIVNSERGFSVTFFGLQKSDSGKYYCGVERYFKDPLLEVNVGVIDAEPSSPRPDPKPVHAAVTTSPSTSSDGPSVSPDVSPTNETLYTPTTHELQSPGDGRVSYLLISLIVLTSLMLLLIAVWGTKKTEDKAVSREDVQEDVQYDEIRHEDQQPESFTTPEVPADPDGVYANSSSVLRTELAAQGDKNYHSNNASLDPAPCPGVHSGGASSQSTDTDRQSDCVYSLAQLPNQRTKPAGRSGLNQSESPKNEIIYVLVQEPQTA